MPEDKCRKLIHTAGIPSNFRVKLSRTGGGMKYVHPENKGISVRVMPDKVHSPHPYQRKPYVVQMKDGKAIDKFGNKIDKSMPEAHIPFNEFIYINN